MHHKSIRDPRRIAYRFRLTSIGPNSSNTPTTTWPLLRRDPNSPTGHQPFNRAIHVAAILHKKGKKVLTTHA